MLKQRFAVLGHPVHHSLSPAMHRAAYAELGVDEASYDAVELGVDDLEAFLDGLDHKWRGLSLTMPLKRRAMTLVDSVDDWASLAGGLNTVLLSEERRLGFNTDVPGAMAALRERVAEPLGEVVVLGGGATAASTLLAAVELGCGPARLLVRDPGRAQETLEQVLAHPRRPDVVVEGLDDALERGPWETDLVISTVPADAQGPALLEATSLAPSVFDVVYDPWPTPLSEAARASGRRCVTGLDLLAHQAVLQLQVMLGESVPADLLRDAALHELRDRGRVTDSDPGGRTESVDDAAREPGLT